MNILIINTRHYFGGGDSTYTFALASLLKKKGHNVYFFAMKSERNIPDPNEDLFVSYIDFKELNRKKNLKSAFQVLSRVIYSQEARSKLSMLLDRIRVKIDIIHLQNIHGHLSPSIIYEAKKRNIPLIWTLHDYKLICPNSHFIIDSTGEICEACILGNYFNAIKKKCKKNSLLASLMAAIEAYSHKIMNIKSRIDLFISPSNFLKQKLLEAGFSRKKIIHLPLFLPDSIFKEKDNSDKGYLLYMGKIEPIKGLVPLLKASKICKKISLKIAGRMDQSFKYTFEKLIPDNVEYIGMKHGKELEDLVLGARAVVLPSLWYENQPFSVLEAFARAKPVIVSDIGGMSELAKQEQIGILVPPGNIELLAEAMRWMHYNQNKARVMGKRAFEYAKRNHSSEVHYKKLIKLYKNL